MRVTTDARPARRWRALLPRRPRLFITLTLLALASLPWASISSGYVPTTYYVRTDGNNSNCTGTTDAAYPGSGTAQPCAFSTIPAAVTAATCGDTIKLKTGQTFDVSAAVQLSNKSCTSGTPITITSTSFAVAPGTRVTSSDATTMAKVRLTGTADGAFIDTSGGSYWRFDGLEITDNTTSVTGYLLNLRQGGRTDVLHCLLHPKEANPTWERAVFRGIWYEGSAGLLVKDSDLRGFLGYQPGGTTVNASVAVASIGGKNVTLQNSFLSAWYAILFTGGGSGANANPTRTATFSGSPTMSSATLSTTTGLVPGMVIRIDWLATGTKSGTTFTQTSGTMFTTADLGTAPGGVSGLGTYFPGSGYTLLATSISSNNWTFLNNGIANIPSGSQSFVAYQAVRVDSVVGNTITYTPVGPTPLTRAPSVTDTRASWCDDGQVCDNASNWNIQGCDFWIDPQFADYQANLDGQLPKGTWEMKHMVGLTVNGCRFTGYPSYIFMPLYSNDGTTPWSTQKGLVFTNNLFDYGLYGGASKVMEFALNDPYHTATPGRDVTVANNLVTGNVQGFLSGKGGTNININHNTIVNNHPAGVSFNAAVTWGDEASVSWTFRDNIVSFRDYGVQCFFGGGAQSDCFPSGVWSKNVVVDVGNFGIGTSVWGSGSALAPVPSSFSAVGFMNLPAKNFRLASGSPFKGQGTGGTDPGADIDVLEAALSAPSATPTPTPTKTRRGGFQGRGGYSDH